MQTLVILTVLALVAVTTSGRRLSSSKLQPAAAIGYKLEKGGPTLGLRTKDNSVEDNGEERDMEAIFNDKQDRLGVQEEEDEEEEEEEEELLQQLSKHPHRRGHKNDAILDLEDLDNKLWDGDEGEGHELGKEGQGQRWAMYKGQQELLGLVMSLTERVQSLQHTMSNIKLQNHYIYRSMKKNYKTCKSSPNDLVIQAAAQKIEKPSCPRGFTENPNTNTCYKFMVERISWRMARERCRNDDSDLVTIETKGEQRWITQQARQNQDTRHCDFWTGGTDKKSEGDWRWVANNNALSYSNWNHNEPNNGRSGEHCMQMLWVFNWAWNDAHCEYPNACFICEVAIGRTAG